MNYLEITWLRGQSDRMCPELRKRVLAWYRPTRYSPCFLQKAYSLVRKRWQKIPVIVQIEEEAMGILSVKSLTKTAGCRMKRDLPLIHAFATDVNEKMLQALLRENRVIKIWYDAKVFAVLDLAAPTVGADVAADYGFTGQGVVIAVLDTGVYNHPDFSGRIVAFKDFINNRDRAYDDNGHGTHVTGCAAAKNERYAGTAPEAGIVGVKVLNKMGAGSLSTVIDGVQWCISNKERLQIRIINLSLGSESRNSYIDDPVCHAVEKAWHAGILVVVAAGNSGPQPRTMNSPGIHPRILTVGALNDHGTRVTSDDQMAEFSSRGPTVDGYVKPDVIAPGVNIIAALSPGSFLDKQNKQARVGDAHTSLSGTSMATPVCAGVIALLLQKKRTLTPDEVKTILKNTAIPLANAGENDQGAGMVDVLRALAALNE